MAAEPANLPALVQRLRSGSEEQRRDALAMLGVAVGRNDAATVDAAVAAEAVPAVVRCLRSGDPSMKAGAAMVLQPLGGRPAGAQQALAAGAVPLLLGMLGSRTDSVAQEGACTLGRLAASSRGCWQAFMAGGGLPLLVSRLRRSSSESLQEKTAWAVRVLSESAERCPDLEAAGAIPAAVGVVRSGSASRSAMLRKAAFQAAAALQNMAATYPSSVPAMVASEAVPALAGLLRHNDSEGAEAAALALGRIVEYWPPRASTAALRAQAVPALLAQLRHSSLPAQEAAARGLATAAWLGAAADMVEAGAVPVLLAMCLSRDAMLQAHAASTIRNLAAAEPDRCASVAPQIMPVLVRLLGSSLSINAQSAAARAMGNLIHDSPARSTSAAAAGAGPALVAALQRQASPAWQQACRQAGLTQEAQMLEAGVLAMLVLDCPDSRAAITAAGGAAALQQAASRTHPGQRAEVAKALAALEAEPAAQAPGRWAMLGPCFHAARLCPAFVWERSHQLTCSPAL